MKLKSFKAEHSGTPLELEEFAELATELDDCAELRCLARDFIAAKAAFTDALAKHEVDVG